MPKVLFLSLVTFSASQNSMGVFHSFVSSDHIRLVQEWVFTCWLYAGNWTKIGVDTLSHNVCATWENVDWLRDGMKMKCYWEHTILSHTVFLLYCTRKFQTLTMQQVLATSACSKFTVSRWSLLAASNCIWQLNDGAQILIFTCNRCK